MKDHFGEILAGLGAPLSKLGQEEPAGCKTSAKVHLVWLLLLLACSYGTWKASRLHSKVTSAMTLAKKKKHA